MKRFTDAGRQSLAEANLYAALSLALTLPDICASLEDPGPGKSKQRYIRWCRQWLEPKYTSELGPSRTPHIFLSAENTYNLRNSLIHSGSGEVDRSSMTNLAAAEFCDDTIGAHCNLFNNVLQLRVSEFSSDIFDSVEEWDAALTSNADVQAEKARLLVIRTLGDTIGNGLIHFGP